MFSQFYESKRVLVTGHTGFKGGWLVNWLKVMGAEVHGIALDPTHELSPYHGVHLQELSSDLRCDIKDTAHLLAQIVSIQPEVIFHLAAQPIVKKSYIDPIDTWQTNLMGTLNVLEAVRGLKKPCVAVIITSDKCYENLEWPFGYRENDRLGGIDPYSASKAAAEIAVSSYARAFKSELIASHISISTARAGNVIGGGDWNQDRLVPDLIRAWTTEQPLEIRSPNSTRPWQHVLEPLSGYLRLAQKQSAKPQMFHGESFNFGPGTATSYPVSLIVKLIAKKIPELTYNIKSQRQTEHEASLLKLNCDKAAALLEWEAFLGISDTIAMTADWYLQVLNANKEKVEETICKTTREQILSYMRRMNANV